MSPPRIDHLDYTSFHLHMTSLTPPSSLIPSQSSVTPHTSAMVLIVDDIEIQIRVLAMLLRHAGITSVDVARDGTEAVDYLMKGNQYLMIFMDILMPKMTGTDAVRLIRRMETSRLIRRNYIVILSMLPRDDVAEACRHLDVEHVICGPIRLKEITKILQSYERSRGRELMGR